MRNHNNIKVSIGIPTYEAGESLVVTLKSLYQQTAYKNIAEIIVVVDANYIKKYILKKIKNAKLKIRYFKIRKGQSGRINDIFREINSPIVILTNDDIIFKNNAVASIIKTYSENQTDLIAGRVKPYNASSLFEKSLKMGNEINNLIARKWNKGDNYLSVNGRFVALSKSMYKKIKIPGRLWNCDAYLYLLAKTHNFSFQRSDNAVAYYKSPTNMKEHLNQSRKFQNSYMDTQRFFKQDISSFYAVPLHYRVLSSLRSLFKNPFSFISYILIYAYTRTHNIIIKKSLDQKPFWETDQSTKKDIKLNK